MSVPGVLDDREQCGKQSARGGEHERDVALEDERSHAANLCHRVPGDDGRQTRFDGVRSPAVFGVALRPCKARPDAIVTLGDSAGHFGLTQLVFTASEQPGIVRVMITQNGEAGAIIGGESLVIDHPQTRRQLLGETP
jgi:hypothetical protein